jgi:hypothetical protein
MKKIVAEIDGLKYLEGTSAYSMFPLFIAHQKCVLQEYF